MFINVEIMVNWNLVEIYLKSEIIINRMHIFVSVRVFQRNRTNRRYVHNTHTHTRIHTEIYIFILRNCPPNYEICTVGQQARNSSRISVTVSRQNSFLSRKPQSFALKAFNYLDEAHPHYGG